MEDRNEPLDSPWTVLPTKYQNSEYREGLSVLGPALIVQDQVWGWVARCWRMKWGIAGRWNKHKSPLGEGMINLSYLREEDRAWFKCWATTIICWYWVFVHLLFVLCDTFSVITSAVSFPGWSGDLWLLCYTVFPCLLCLYSWNFHAQSLFSSVSDTGHKCALLWIIWTSSRSGTPRTSTPWGVKPSTFSLQHSALSHRDHHRPEIPLPVLPPGDKLESTEACQHATLLKAC